MATAAVFYQAREGPSAYQGYATHSAYYAQPPGQAASAAQGEVRTLVISGFPRDIRSRELNNLLVLLPGYQASVLIWDENDVRGHALFATPTLALEALQRVDKKVEFDAGVVLRAELAAEDLRLEEGGDQEKRGRAYSPTQPASAAGAPPAAATPSVAPSPPAMPAYIAPAGVMPYPAQFVYTPAAVPSPPRAYGPVKNNNDNFPPCNTLFCGNLGEGVDENELRAVFGSLPGFQQVKVVHGPRGVSAFIEFADVATAAACHHTQQGLLLASSDRGPIRVQYSKNPFGRKRDSAGTPLAGAAGAPPGAVAIPAGYAAYALPMQAAPAYAGAAGLMYA